jgi:hypothetical protein
MAGRDEACPGFSRATSRTAQCCVKLPWYQPAATHGCHCYAVCDRALSACVVTCVHRRQRACEALKRLHTSEVLQERARRRRWEAGLSQWRTLRSEHAIDSFAKRLASCEFTETEAALRLFGQLREAQQEAARKLLEHVRSAAPRMMPPGTSAAAAAAWGEEGERLCGEWDARLADGLGALEKQDSETEAQVRRLVAPWRTGLWGKHAAGGRAPPSRRRRASRCHCVRCARWRCRRRRHLGRQRAY